MNIIIGALVAVCSAIVGASLTYFLSKKLVRQTHENTIEISKITNYNRAATKFREAFTEELVIIESRVKGRTPDTDEILEAAFQKHLRAVNEFRHFLPEKDIPAFDNAWAECHKIDGEHDYKQYAEEFTGFHNNHSRDPHMAAIERIAMLLKFAAPK